MSSRSGIQTTKDTFLPLFKLLGHQKKLILLVIAALGMHSFFHAALLVFMGPFIMVIFQEPGGQQKPDLFDLLPEQLGSLLPSSLNIPFEQNSLNIAIPLLLVAFSLGNSLATYLYNLNQKALSLRLSQDLRNMFFAKILGQSYEKIVAVLPSEWMSHIMNDIMYLQERFSESLGMFVKDLLTVLTAAFILIFLSWQTALLLLIVAPFLTYGLGTISEKIAYYAENFQKQLAKMSATILDIRRRFTFIQSQNGEKNELDRFGKLNADYYNTIRKSILMRSAFSPGIEFLSISVLALSIYLLKTDTLGIQLEGKTVLVFFTALGMSIRPLKNIGEQLSKLQETKGAISKTIETINTTHSDTVAPITKNPAQFPIIADSIDIKRSNKLIFSSQDKIEIELGQAIAVIGPSGAGKSTLIKSLAGLIPPNKFEGNCEYDQLTARCSYVSQIPYLFHDSIESNLSYGNSSPSLGEINKALEDVHLLEKINSLDSQLDSQVSSVESNLSGGQIQRLVIARALLKKKELILFDEATSAIDMETERKILNQIIQTCKSQNKSLIAITHRTQSLPFFDEIWYLKDGKIDLQGPTEKMLSHPTIKSFCHE